MVVDTTGGEKKTLHFEGKTNGEKKNAAARQIR